MAEGVLASLECKALLAPKLLTEAKAAQVVWARVKGYPAWPAQVLTEAAALRRKDLGQERHSKGNSVPVMFFGTVEVAWVKDADVVDFKEGLHQGFFDRKTKPFKLALEQVCEYLALDRKRKAPPKWWCKPPSNGLDEQLDGPSLKQASAPSGGVGKGTAQRQDTAKDSRPRSASPAASSESSSSGDGSSSDDGSSSGGGPSSDEGSSSEAGSSSDEEAAVAPRPTGKKAAIGKAGAASKDVAPASSKGKAEPAASALVHRPRDSSSGRPTRVNGSTAASTTAALQAHAKKPPPAPAALPPRQQLAVPAPRAIARDTPASRSAPVAAAPASQQGLRAQQPPKAGKSVIVTSTMSAKDSEGSLQPRKRLKVEASPAGATGSAAGTISNGVKLAPPPVKGTTLPADDQPDIDPAALKLPAEIRRLAGIRLPAVPKKAGAKVDPSPRQHLDVKVEHPAPSTAPGDAPAGARIKAEDVKVAVEACVGRTTRSSCGAATAGGADGGRARAVARGKRPRRSSSPSGDDTPSSSASEEDEEEEAQSSGEEADSEAAESSSESEKSGDSDAEDANEAADAARKDAKRAPASHVRRSRTRAQRQQPSRDRRGEKQRRMARLTAPEPADRRTSSRLKPADKPAQAPANPSRNQTTDDEDSENGSDRSQEESVDTGDDKTTVQSEVEESAVSSSSSSDDEEGPTAKDSANIGGRDSQLRPAVGRGASTRSNPARKAAAGDTRGRSRESGQRPNSNRQVPASGGEATDEDGMSQKQQQAATRTGTTVAAAASAPPKAVPLELRRLQNSASAGVPVVDTTEPRTLRERASPARRAVASIGVTPTATGATMATCGRRLGKRCSDDGSGASMSPDAERNRLAERTKSPEHSREEFKGSAAAEGKSAPKAGRAQALEGQNGKTGSAVGSASPPPPGPLAPGGVPVRRKPPSLGVPSNGRQLPAIIPARAVLRSLTSKRDAPPLPSTLPAGMASAGTSAAGALAPLPVCVARKPSMGPPTRRALDPGAEVPLSSTDLPDIVTAEADADAKHASSPDVAAGGTAGGGDPLPRSPEPTSLDEAGKNLAAAAAGTALETQVERQPLTAEPTSAGSVEQESEAALQQCELAAQGPAASQDLGQASLQGDAMDVDATSSRQGARGVLHDVEPQTLRPHAPEQMVIQQAEPSGPEPMAVETSAVPDLVPEATQDPGPQVEAACARDAHKAEIPAAEAAEQGPLESVEQAAEVDPTAVHGAVPSGCPVARREDSGQTDDAQERPCASPRQQRPLALEAGAEEGLAGGASRSCSRPPSPIREDGLLAEEQLPDQVDERPTEPATAPAVVAVAGAICSQSGTLGTAPPARLTGQSVNPGQAASSLTCGGTGHGTAAAPPREGTPPAEESAARIDAQELEELGEVAATLAGLQRAEVPWPLPTRLTPPLVPCVEPASVAAASASVDASSLDRLRNRAVRGGGFGRERSAMSRESAPAASNASGSTATVLQGFRWPQSEPILPAHEQPFVLPRDWLVTRPPRYEPIKRSTWLSRAKPKRLPRDEISICACRPPPLSPPGELQRMGCGQHCLNRHSSVLCDPKMCPCGELCSNRSLHLLRPPKTEPFLTENRGWGVCAMEPVYKGGFIVEYAGEVIDDRELGRRMDHARMNGEPHFYIMELSAGLYIDARRKGNIARLINSSCEPNCETQKWHDAATGEIRVGIFATRDIAPGEELVYDYFFSTYGAMKQSAAAFVCMCGSKNCRGTMDLHPEKRRDLGRRVEVFWDADGQFYRAVIVAYHPTSRKHTIMYEDGGTEKLLLEEVPHRWLEDDPTKTSPPKSGAHRAQQDSAAQPQPMRQEAILPQLGQDSNRNGSEQVQAGDGNQAPNPTAGPMSLSVVQAAAAQAVPALEMRFSLPGLATSPEDRAAVDRGPASLGKHSVSDGDLHLPLKKRQKMMQQQVQQQQPAPIPGTRTPSGPQSAPSPEDGAGVAGQSGGAPPVSGVSHLQGSGGSGDVVTGGRRGNSSGGADSGGGEANVLSGRTSFRPELSGTGSGRVSGVATDEDANDDLDSLLEAAEAVAALRTAPIAHPPHPSVSAPAPDTGLPLQPRHIRSTPSAGMAMVQAAKVTSPRHLAAVHRAGPPNGLPPHGGSAASRPSASNAAHPSSSSSGLPPHHSAAKPQPGWASGQNGSFQQDGNRSAPQERHGRTVRDAEGLAHGGSGRDQGTNGFGSGRNAANGSGDGSGGMNREDLLWRLVGIEKPKDLLPLFAGDCKMEGDANQKRGNPWVAPSHPYSKLLQALEASELLPHADQLRQYAQQQQQQSHPAQYQQHRCPSSKPQAHAHPQLSQAAQPQPPPHSQQAPLSAQAQPLPQLPPVHSQAAAVPASAAMESLTLSAWQHAAQQHHHHSHQAARHAAHTALPNAAYNSHVQGLDGNSASIAALLHAQQHQHAAAAAAAAMAASAGQLHTLGHQHALHGHSAHVAAAAAAAAAAASLAGGALPAGQHLAPQHLAAGAWPHVAHGQQSGHILQDLVQMYVAQQAAAVPHHPILAMAGMAAVAGGPPRCA